MKTRQNKIKEKILYKTKKKKNIMNFYKISIINKLPPQNTNLFILIKYQINK